MEAYDYLLVNDDLDRCVEEMHNLIQLQHRNEAPETPVSTLEDMEKQMIRQTLEKCGGNLSAVASQLGITRQTLYNKMKKYGL